MVSQKNYKSNRRSLRDEKQELQLQRQQQIPTGWQKLQQQIPFGDDKQERQKQRQQQRRSFGYSMM